MAPNPMIRRIKSEKDTLGKTCLLIMQIKLLKIMLDKYFSIASASACFKSSSGSVATPAAASLLIPRPDEHLLCGCAVRYTGAGSSFGVPQMPDITQMSPCSSKTTITKHMVTAAGWIRAGLQEKRRERMIKERIQLVTLSRPSAGQTQRPNIRSR